ncbi:MAG: hypothetical protein IIB13_01330 [Chloroflexi bacterium]|nr:hypothetical protein [Chloroflexota bacterium]
MTDKATFSPCLAAFGVNLDDVYIQEAGTSLMTDPARRAFSRISMLAPIPLSVRVRLRNAALPYARKPLWESDTFVLEPQLNSQVMVFIPN